MPIYKISNDNLKHIDEAPFKLEKEIQSLCENNLDEVFDLEFVSTEFAINNFRLDTLAFDRKVKAFVIIEYKKTKNFSVIDQGYAYLSAMLNNKSDFILEYNESCRSTLKRNDVDWSQSRIVFISPSFTTYQCDATNFKDLPIELWEIKRYSNNTVSFNFISTSGARESIKTISKGNKEIEAVNKEIKVYTEDDLLTNIPDDIMELYEKFKFAILEIDENITTKATKLYMSFVLKSNLVDITILKKSLKVWINSKFGSLDDPKQLTRDVSGTGHWGNGDYEIQAFNDDDFEYIIGMIKQSYRQNKDL